jgi:hypothetical protein
LEDWPNCQVEDRGNRWAEDRPHCLAEGDWFDRQDNQITRSRKDLLARERVEVDQIARQMVDQIAGHG